MIRVRVYMSNENPERLTKKEYIDISKEELKQLACNKARGEFGSKYNGIESTDDIRLNRSN